MRNYLLTESTLKKFKRIIKDELYIFLGNRKLNKIGYWFIDIPRTSSSSVKVAMNRSFGFPYGKRNIFEKEYSSYSPYQDHLKAKHARKVIGQKIWNNLKKFTIVRNPYERIISIYFYNQTIKAIHHSMSINDFVNTIKEAKYQNVNWQFLEYKRRWIPAFEFLLHEGKLDKSIHIIKYENRLEELYEFFEGQIEKDELSINIQSSNSIHYDNYQNILNENSIEIINDIYNYDFALFGYEKIS